MDCTSRISKETTLHWDLSLGFLLKRYPGICLQNIQNLRILRSLKLVKEIAIFRAQNFLKLAHSAVCSNLW